jgi:hypothetical protein
VTSAAGPSAAFQTASLQVNILTLAKCPASTCAVTKPLPALPTAAQANKTAADNATSALEGLAPAVNATESLDALNTTSAVDAINATAGALDALNGTALNGTSALDVLNATTALDTLNRTGIKSDVASKAAAAAGVKPAEASKPKSAAAASSPMSVFAAACAMAVVGVFAL